MNSAAHSEFYWQQNSETFFAQYWVPSQPKAIVCVLHGYGGNSGRYARAAEQLVGKGFGVVAMDCFGHGKTTGLRGDSPSYEAIMDSIQMFLDETGKIFPDYKKFLWGHSMGAGYVVNYVLRRKPRIAGAVFGSPYLKMKIHPHVVKLYLWRLINKIYPKIMTNANVDLMPISRDTEVVEEYLKDPLVHLRISGRAFIEGRIAGRWAIQNADKLNIPCLLIHGTADVVNSINASKEFASKASEEFLTFKAWNGYFHELHNEPEPYRTEVLNYIMNWLEIHL